MAKGKKTGGRDFKKGHKLGGRPKLPDDIRAARNLSYEDMCRMVIEVRGMSPKDAEKKLKQCELGMRAIITAYLNLDYRAIKEYEDRLFGKAKDIIDIDTPKDIKIIYENIKK